MAEILGAAIIPLLVSVALTGLVIDSVALLFRKETKLAAAVAGILSLLVLFLSGTALYLLFLPSLGKVYLNILYILVPVAIIQGAVGGLLGRFIYLKLKKTNVVKRIQGEE